MDMTKLDLRVYVDFKVTGIMPIKKNFGFRVALIYENGDEKVKQHASYKTISSAKKGRDQIVSQLYNNTYVVYSNILVKEFLEYWYDYVIKHRLTSNSRTTYENCINKHIVPKIGKIKLVELNKGHVNKLYTELAKKYKSIPRIAKTILNTSMRYALSKKLIVNDPSENVDLPKGMKKKRFKEITIDEQKTLTIEQIKILLQVAKKSRIYMQLVLALLMGLRRSEINGLKYADINYEKHTLKIQRQLGEDPDLDPQLIPKKTKTKQEIKLKTEASYRELDIPDYVYQAILEERKRYESNRSRRQHGPWIFQDMDFICCSSYGRPRSKSYHFQHYKKLLQENNLPDIRFHDLRHTYTTVLMKKDINQKAIAAALGHASSVITVDVYTDKQAIIDLESYEKVMQPFIDAVIVEETIQVDCNDFTDIQFIDGVVKKYL